MKSFNLDDKPLYLRKWAIISLFTLVIGVGSVYLFLFAPKIKEIDRVSNELAYFEEKICEAKRLRAAYGIPGEKEKMCWEETKVRFWSKIPSGENLLQLMENLAGLARESGIMDISFCPVKRGGAGRLGRQLTLSLRSKKEAESNSVCALESKLDSFFLETSFHCHYRELADFLEGVETLPRLIEMESIYIRRELPKIAVEMAIKAYFLKREKDAYK